MSGFSKSQKLRVPVIHEQEEANHGVSEEDHQTSVKAVSVIGTSMKSASAVSESPVSAKGKLQRKGSETEQRLASMREKFSLLQMMEEGENEAGSPFVALNTNIASPLAAVNTPTNAVARWTKLRKVVNWPKELPRGGITSSGSRINASLSTLSVQSSDSTQLSPRDQSGRMKRKIIKRPSENSADLKTDDSDTPNIELEDISLGQMWTDSDIPEPTDPSDNLPILSLLSEREEFTGVMTADVFNEDSQQLSVTVSRIPEAVVAARQAEIERLAQEERLKMLQKLRDREKDIDYRETAAKDAVTTKEQEARKRLDAEKSKVASMALRKEKTLAQDFRKMREELEAGIKRQQGAVKEHFGKLLVHQETLARRFQAASKMTPQPVEFRIHLMRAVKNKLPKGLYVLMLTQYDAIGGRPLSWTRIGANGIGDLRPGITRTCKHEGRYFDRILRVEDSCFALCPPRPMLKPNFVFVLELFQLASKHNPSDKIEAWTALPMSYESMSIVEGKFKLPMLRGEHNQSVQHFQGMENLMAADLHNWLCNIYIEVRHMSMDELGAADDLLMTTNFDMDYFNKSFIPLDVNGNPLLSRAQQEELQLERDLEAAGFAGAAASESTRVRIQEASRILQQSETDGTYATPLMPVDKGIFRRKVNHPSAHAGAQASTHSAASGISGEEEEYSRGNNNNNNTMSALGMSGRSTGHSAKSTASGMNAEQSTPLLQQSPSQGATEGGGGGGDSDGEKKKNPTRSSGKILSSIKEDGAVVGGASSRSILGMLGLSKHNSTASAAMNSPSSRHSNKSLLLKNDDNFLEHRKLLVQRWKENIYNKYPKQQFSPSPQSSPRSRHGSSFMYPDSTVQEDEEVLERGYNIQDEVFLHREQRGKLSGMEMLSNKEDRQWAAAGLEGKIVRRWQSEGPRFDSEAVPDIHDLEAGNSVSNKNYILNTEGGQGNGNNGNNAYSRVRLGGIPLPGTELKTWEELRDVREMEDYTMSICADPSRKKSVVPGSKTASKLRYIRHEMFGDFNYNLWGTFEFYLAVFIYLFALWIRIYVHYLAQYLYIVSVGTPVFNFKLMVFQIVQKYMSASVSVAAEVGIVAMGPLANLCVYICFVGLALLAKKSTIHLPDVLSKFFIAFGFATILDPFLILVIDLIYGNYDCRKSSDICQENYLSPDCTCFNGDFVKLWYRMRIEEGSGLTGLFITVLLYMGTGIVGLLLLYHYIVYVHRDGRVLDMWRRINGTVEEFFLPLDFEVSDVELNTIVHKAIHWRGPKGSKRRLEVTEYTEMDPEDPNYMEHYKKFIIIEIDEKKNRSVFREFQLEPTGAILEIFDKRNATYTKRSIFNKELLQGNMPNQGETDREEGDSPDGKDDDEEEAENSRRSPRSASSGYRSNRSPREPYSGRGVQVLSSERSPLLAANSFKPSSSSNMSGTGSARGAVNLHNGAGSARGASAGSSRRPPQIEVDHAVQYDNISDHGDDAALGDAQDHGYIEEDANYDSVEEMELIPMSRKHK